MYGNHLTKASNHLKLVFAVQLEEVPFVSHDIGSANLSSFSTLLSCVALKMQVLQLQHHHVDHQHLIDIALHNPLLTTTYIANLWRSPHQPLTGYLQWGTTLSTGQSFQGIKGNTHGLFASPMP